MKIRIPWRKKEIVAVEAPVNNAQRNLNYKNFIVKAVGMIAKQGFSREQLIEPEYNLEEIRAAAETDSYIKMALMRYRYLVYKAGYQLKSNNEAAAEYIKKRFRIMSFATGKPMDILFQEIADDIVTYANAFLVKARVDRLMPGIHARGIFNDKPIGGYFRIDPSTMKIKRDKNGTVLKYVQVVDGEEKQFNPSEVIHFYMDREANNAYGTPRIVAALEDVKLLRRIEGNIVSLIYRFAMPIYQWIVGLAQPGFQATDQEIKEVQKEIENMPLDGVIVTNEKTVIKAVGAEGEALDASKYLEYFEKRVFTALGVSEAQMGRGGSKQDADSMEAQVHDTVKYIQRVIAVFTENYIINELLLEGGFNPILNEDDIVTYEFNEISLDTKVKIENHELLKFQSNLISFDEARHAIGKKSNIDEDKLYVNMIETKSVIEQIKAKTEGSLEIAKLNAANAAASKAVSPSGNGQTKSAKPSDAVVTNNRPTNQYGTTSVKIKEDYDDETQSLEMSESTELTEKSVNKIKKHKKLFSSIYKRYENLRNDITDTNVDLDMLFPVAKDSIMAEIKTHIQLKAYDGMSKAISDLNVEKDKNHYLLPNMNMSLEQFYEEAEKTLKGILNDIKKRVKTNRDTTAVNAVVNSLEYRLRFLLEFIMPKVYWYSYIKAGAFYGIEKAYIVFNGSSDAETHPAEIDTKAFSIDDIPAYHSFCDCKVSFKAGDKD